MTTPQPTNMDNNSPPLTLAKLDELINTVEGGATVLWTAAGEIPLGVPVEQMTTEQLAAAKSLALNNGIDWDKLRERLERPLSEPPTEPMDAPAAINIVFDGPPGPEGPRFIEVETDDGRSIRVGEWQRRQDGNWGLRIAALPLQTAGVPQDPDVDPENDLLQRVLQECVNTELSAMHAVGILHSAALLMGSNTFPLMDPKIYDLMNPEQEER